MGKQRHCCNLAVSDLLVTKQIEQNATIYKAKNKDWGTKPRIRLSRPRT